jgi:hypothetical protein
MALLAPDCADSGVWPRTSMAAPQSDASESGAVVVPRPSLLLLFLQDTQREVRCVRLCMHRHISVDYTGQMRRALLHSGSE